VAGRIGGWLGGGAGARRWLGGVALSSAIVASLWFQSREPHPSRWGHLAAGRWLLLNAQPGEAVLDTRGWAAHVSRLRAYDYWHVRQALTDARLRFWVVGEDEYQAASPRGQTLRALLAHAGEPAAAFPECRDGRTIGVRVFRFQRPESWEGLRP
jgi:hypothetical protein